MNQKDNISEIFLKKLKESSDLDITKLNKICPIVDQAKKKEELYNTNIRQKIIEKKTNDSIKFKTGLEQYQNNFVDSSKIFKDYEKFQNVSRSEKYGEAHNDYGRKYWDKFHVEKFLSKNQKEYKENLKKYNEKEERMKYYNPKV